MTETTITGHVCVDARVTGRVQGVGYRDFVRRQATRRGVYGWARNCPDGSVAVRLCGAPGVVNEVKQALHEGPKWSRVSSVDSCQRPCEALTNFTVG